MIWFSAEVTPWRDDGGQIGGPVISTHDVTSMVEALEAASKSEQRLTLALELANIHVWEMDYARRELIKVGAEDMFFTEPKTFDALYDDIFCTIDLRDRARVEAAWAAHVEDGAPYKPEYRIIRTDDEEVWTSSACRLIHDELGRPSRLIGAMQNITEHKAAELALFKAKEDAEAANLAKSAFLATMSHEIRTPLNGVLGMAQAMAADDLSATQREHLNVIRRSGETLLTILNDILDLSKIEAGKLDLEQVEFDLGDLAGGVCSAFLAIANGKGVDFALAIDATARGVYLGDATRIRQILHNLVSNALKFTEQGEVRLTVSRLETGLKFVITDTGVGIPADRLPKLFQKFEQADASTTRRFGGTGLGLAICRQLTDVFGGSVEVQSIEGRGSRFSVELPLVRLGDERPMAPAPETGVRSLSADRPLQILAAEDNSVNQLVLRTLLGHAGVDPFIVSDGAEAVAAWRERAWDVILMDVQMPVMDGPTATQMIRRLEREAGRPRTPIIALTANAMPHQAAEYIAAGMDAFVPKPIEIERLFATLERVLDGEPSWAEGLTGEVA